METMVYGRRAGRTQVNYIQFQELVERVDALEKEIKALKAKPKQEVKKNAKT